MESSASEFSRLVLLLISKDTTRSCFFAGAQGERKGTSFF